ncbi:PREDICTED: uncharacterized protein LOC104727993 [Camelina sativa]|uniref:Uncharacterized protein LOC104727993 n=1 Tax=Camelina sativa TaxID=90675 RepID=A0ABM0US44_CAMSA|nr:PREDICTED: uncharacterized protein LOC104727993 [Camelina sativa]
MWKCLSNSLSVAGNLAYRHLSRESTCIRCPENKESVNHLLFKCTYARLIWALALVPGPADGEWTESLYTNLYWVLNLAEENGRLEKQAMIVPWILWRLWKNRNELVFKGRKFEAEEVTRRAVEDSEEWRNRKEGTALQITPRVDRGVSGQWRPPPNQWLKCNTDASWHHDHNRCGIGWVLRNEQGEVIWVGARALPKPKTAMEAEVEAMRWALLMVSRFQYKNIIFESDAQVVINLLKNREY